MSTRIITLLLSATAAQSQSMREVPINDPVLEMRAWTLTAPANWKAEGTMLPGSSCSSATSPVYRASNPDGQAGAYFLARIDWAWGPGVRPGNDCLPFREAVSAKDFLTYMTRILDVGFVREEPVPELAEMLRNNESFNQQSRGMMRIKSDMARYLVRYSVNGKPVEEWLTAIVNCRDSMVMAVGHQYGCAAFVTRWFAPLGKLQSLIPTFQAMKMTLNQPWMDQWTAVMVRHIQVQSQRQTDALLEQGRLAQAQRTRQHQDFMASMERGRDLRNQQFADGQFQKQRNKEDYVDYILDCQRLSNGEVRVAIGNCPVRQTQ
jgi:hypothetical protein